MASKLEEALKAWEAKYAPRVHTHRQRTVYALCPPAIRFGQDQYRCQECGNVWDVDEPRPACQKSESKGGDK